MKRLFEQDLNDAHSGTPNNIEDSDMVIKVAIT
jgi:hypothetical protein